MKIPTGFCASIFQREQTSPAGPPRTSGPWLRQSTPGPARYLDGVPLPRSTNSSYPHWHKPVLHRPLEPAQYTSVRFGETLMLAGLTPSIGSVGDAYDNALAETTIGLYKTEAVRKDSPFRRGPLDRLTDVELLTADWVHWYNTSRLMHRLGRTPPVEYEAAHYAERATAETEAHQ